MINKLQDLFPQSTTEPPQVEEEYIQLTLADGKLYLPYQDLSEREQSLIQALGQATKTSLPSHSPWLSYLQEDRSQPPSHTLPATWLYLQVQGVYDQAVWQETFQSALDQLLALFPYDHSIWIGLIELSQEPVIIDQLEELVATLDIDFEIVTRLLVGQQVSHTELLRPTFQVEYPHFQAFIESSRPAHVKTLQEAIIDYQLTQAINFQVDLPNLTLYLAQHEEAREIVQALYQAGGNLTQAADLLYIHRNTLLYRLNKFNQATGFNLQSLQDLILAYLTSRSL